MEYLDMFFSLLFFGACRQMLILHLITYKKMLRTGSSNIAVTGGQNTIVIELQSSQPFHRLKGVFSYDQLPIQFRVLFENIQDFHSYLIQNTTECLRTEDRKLYVQVNVAGRIRQYMLPLQILELTPEQQLKERIWILQEMVENKQKKIEKDRVYIQSLRKKIEGQDIRINQLEKKNREKDVLIVELRNQITTMKELLRGQTSESMKLKGYCRQLENRQDQDFQIQQEEKQRQGIPLPPTSSSSKKKNHSSSNSKKKSKTSKSPAVVAAVVTQQSMQIQHKLIEATKIDPNLSSPKQNSSAKVTASPSTVKSDKQKSETKEEQKILKQENFGELFMLEPCKECKYLGKFDLSNNGIVQKLHGPTYQLYNGEALPLQGRFHFDVRIILIKNNNIVVGVITEKCKEEQFSFKKMNCICYNGYDGSICEEDRQKYVNFKPKEGNRIRTVVDMTSSRVDWYIMDGNQVRNHIGSAVIPPSMLKQPLFPYFQLYWEGNKVKLN